MAIAISTTQLNSSQSREIKRPLFNGDSTEIDLPETNITVEPNGVTLIAEQSEEIARSTNEAWNNFLGATAKMEKTPAASIQTPEYQPQVDFTQTRELKISEIPYTSDTATPEIREPQKLSENAVRFDLEGRMPFNTTQTPTVETHSETKAPVTLGQGETTTSVILTESVESLKGFIKGVPKTAKEIGGAVKELWSTYVAFKLEKKKKPQTQAEVDAENTEQKKKLNKNSYMQKLREFMRPNNQRMRESIEQRREEVNKKLGYSARFEGSVSENGQMDRYTEEALSKANSKLEYDQIAHAKRRKVGMAIGKKASRGAPGAQVEATNLEMVGGNSRVRGSNATG